jgi:alkanesulfonate monooxygenase SsuD/methylene tetrahydromethanopterin reductase-like flavin-dependent oxidoreductase (luciferase family)
MPLSYAGRFKESAAQATELERAGLDMVWVAEAYGFDGVSLMGYLAAVTQRLEIGAAILPIYTRTPTLLAMTAAGVDALSDGRCVLGLGASGPRSSRAGTASPTPSRWAAPGRSSRSAGRSGRGIVSRTRAARTHSHCRRARALAWASRSS